MSTNINDAVKQAEQALDKRDAKATETKPPQIDMPPTKEPEISQAKEDPILLDSEEKDKDNEEKPKNIYIERMNALSTTHKAMIVLGIMVAVVIFGPSPSEEVINPTESVPSESTMEPGDSEIGPESIEDDFAIGAIDESLADEMDIVPAPDDQLNFGISETDPEIVNTNTDTLAIDASDIVSVDVPDDTEPVEIIETVGDNPSEDFNLEGIHTEELEFEDDIEPQVHDILNEESTAASKPSKTEAIELNLAIDDTEHPLDSANTPTNTSTSAEDLMSTEESGGNAGQPEHENTQLVDQLKAQNVLLQQLADKINNLESKSPGKDYHYAPNVDLLYVAPASRHCKECVDHAVLMYKGDKVHVANNETFIGYKVVLENNRLKLSKNGVEHSYFPIKE